MHPKKQLLQMIEGLDDGKDNPNRYRGFRKGGNLGNFLDGIALEYQKQDGIASKKTQLDLQNIDLQSRINAIQEKEAKARNLALDLQSASKT